MNCYVAHLAIVLAGVVTVNAAPADPSRPVVKVVANGESPTKPDDCRGIIVGPGINQLEPFPGYRGFVGWESPVRLTSGEWLVGFNAGYWHASPPSPLNYSAKTLQEYVRMGLPADIVAPTGGRVMVTRSTDKGKTWSKPETLIDTPADDRHPAFVELKDGTILCSFFTYAGEPKNGDASNEPAGACGSFGHSTAAGRGKNSPAGFRHLSYTMRPTARCCGSTMVRCSWQSTDGRKPALPIRLAFSELLIAAKPGSYCLQSRRTTIFGKSLWPHCQMTTSS